MVETLERSDWRSKLRLDDPHFYVNDNRALFQQMHREEPVFWYEPGQFWAVTRHADVRALMADKTLLSNAKGTLINSRGDDWVENYLAKSGRLTLVFSDPPFHTELKNALLKLLSPKRLRALQGRMQEIVDEILDAAPSDVEYDFCEEFAGRLPAEMVASLLDVPTEIMPSFYRWATATRDSTELSATGNWDEITRNLGEMHHYFEHFVAERRASPGDDFVSGLLAVEIDGKPLGDEWVLGMCGTLVAAGFESARNFLMSAAKLLADHPDQRAMLAADDSLWPAALEEMLRYNAPSNGVARYVLRDIEVRGKTIRKGDWIVFMLGAANVDEDIWPDALSFDITRSPRTIATFGAGPHLCLGNMLAKTEVRIALQTLISRFPDYQVVGNPVRRPSTLSNSYNNMSVLLGGKVS